MNFFERQHAVRKVSARLVWLFAIAVVVIVAVIDAVAWVVLGLATMPTATAVQVIVAISLLVIALVGITSGVKTMMLRRGGGAAVARSLGGVPVPADTTDPELRRLRNVVEEIAIASGTPVPDLYVLADEPGINAFAAGWTPADAAIAVTAGTLRHLNRDELQGVIAHEFSHVVNGDMRLNIRLMGVLAGILGLAVVGRVLLSSGRRGRGRDSKGAGALTIVALAALVVGYIGVFAGRIIKAAVSRQREYLADASAVQFTRQTEGLAGALKKIAGLPTGSAVRHGKSEDVSHMLFGESRRFTRAFATHPPLAKRIQLLDPAFDPGELERLRTRWAAAPPSGLREDAALGLASTPSPRRTPPVSVTGRVPARPDDVVATVGNPAAGSFPHAEGLLARIPEDVRDRARRPDTVVPLLYGLLLATDPRVRQRQHQLLAARQGKPLADAACREGDVLARLEPDLRLPLSELALPALRQRPSHEIATVLAAMKELAGADGAGSVFEYCLSTLVSRDLHEARHRAAPWGKARTTLARSHTPVATLLATLAAVGNPDPREAEAAYRAGLALVLPSTVPPFAPPAHAPSALDTVWPALDGLPASEKQRLVAAVAAVIADDGMVSTMESELLRTVCWVLRCPLPPLAGVGTAEPPPRDVVTEPTAGLRPADAVGPDGSG